MKAFNHEAAAVSLLVIGMATIPWAFSIQFGYVYETPKFLVFTLMTLLLSFSTFSSKTQLSLPSSKALRQAFAVSVFGVLASALFSPGGELISGVATILIWLNLVLCILRLSQQQGSEAFLKRLIKWQTPISVFYILYIFWGSHLNNPPVRALFSNPNITSDFIALSVLQLMFSIEAEKKKSLKIFLGLAALLGFFLIANLKSRTAFCALSLGSLFFVKDYILKSRSWVRYKKVFLGLSLPISLIFAYILYLKGTSSISLRFVHWHNTLCLIRENFWGTSPGGFGYFFERYNGKCVASSELRENLYLGNPHNAFLEVIAEVGVIGGIAFLVFLAIIVWELYKTKSSPKNHFSRRWLACHGLALSALAFFGFPQDQPYTLLFIALFVGVALSLLPSGAIKNSSPLRIYIVASSILLLGVFVIKAYSNHLTARVSENRLVSVRGACSLDKENWRACVEYAKMNLEMNEFETADRIISELQTKFSGHHATEELLAHAFYKKGNLAEACKHLKNYEAIFRGPTSKHDFIKNNCP